ncbi:hypothetical protein IW140_000773 [Coemansia sp. RSA 1813]|nr:hypothetical protein EV178_000723 [Coemansia sp. RSA 1646]KAJ1773641.1 hypothetical protein LPJ74_000557 [Coemansia sp. RSA 1843]KAJ2572658.1 hypothetical protein IW140_000773 [Coemansia sp. RSA 1813]
MHSKQTSVVFSQKHVSNNISSTDENNENTNNQGSSLGLPTISPCSTEGSSNPKSKRFVPTQLDMGAVKDHITHLVLPSPIGSMPQAHVFSTGMLSPKLPTSSAVSPNETNISSFVPYLMTIAEPRALDLQRTSHISIVKHQQTPPDGDTACGQSSAAENKADLASARISTGQLTPRTGDNSMELDARPNNESTSMRIKRSISTILRRSTSILRKSEPTSPCRSGSTRRSSNSEALLPAQLPKSAPVSRFSTEQLSRSKGAKNTNTPSGMPSPTPSYPETTVLGAALSFSCFSMMFSNGIVSPLIRGSMVHIKVVMDAGTIVIVPMMRSEVFARARERILTKLFQGGIPLVESKRRKFVACRANGSSLVIENNPTWRKVMDATKSVHRMNAHRSVHGRVVAKLTLHLMDQQDEAVLSESRQPLTAPCDMSPAKPLGVADEISRASLPSPISC